MKFSGKHMGQFLLNSNHYFHLMRAPYLLRGFLTSSTQPRGSFAVDGVKDPAKPLQVTGVDLKIKDFIFYRIQANPMRVKVSIVRQRRGETAAANAAGSKTDKLARWVWTPCRALLFPFIAAHHSAILCRRCLSFSSIATASRTRSERLRPSLRARSKRV